MTGQKQVNSIRFPKLLYSSIQLYLGNGRYSDSLRLISYEIILFKVSVQCESYLELFCHCFNMIAI